MLLCYREGGQGAGDDRLAPDVAFYLLTYVLVKFCIKLAYPLLACSLLASDFLSTSRISLFTTLFRSSYTSWSLSASPSGRDCGIPKLYKIWAAPPSARDLRKSERSGINDEDAASIGPLWSACSGCPF